VKPPCAGSEIFKDNAGFRLIGYGLDIQKNRKFGGITPAARQGKGKNVSAAFLGTIDRQTVAQ